MAFGTDFFRDHCNIIGLAAPLALAILATTASQSASAAGKPGPHGGLVEKAGPFSLEISQAGESRLNVYVYDSRLKKATLEDSSVGASVREGGAGSKETTLACAPENDVFACQAPNEDLLKHGELVLRSLRKGKPGKEVALKLPLSRQVIR